MFTIPLVFKALVLVGLGVAIAIPCFIRTCGDPVVRFGETSENLKLYWVGLAAGLVLVGSGLVTSVSAANEMGAKKACPSPAPAAQSASYSSG